MSCSNDCATTESYTILGINIAVMAILPLTPDQTIAQRVNKIRPKLTRINHSRQKPKSDSRIHINAVTYRHMMIVLSPQPINVLSLASRAHILETSYL